MFAAAAQMDLIAISGDKRAIRSLKHVTAVHHALAGRIAVLDAIFLALCEQLGSDRLRQRVAPLLPHDKMAAVCFSAEGSDPREGLRSYYRKLVTDVNPLLVWSPETRRAT